MRVQLHFQRLQLRLRQLGLQLRSLQFVRAVFAIVVESVDRAQDRVVGEERRGDLQDVTLPWVEPSQELRLDQYLEDGEEEVGGRMHGKMEQPARRLNGERA